MFIIRRCKVSDFMIPQRGSLMRCEIPLYFFYLQEHDPARHLIQGLNEAAIHLDTVCVVV